MTLRPRVSYNDSMKHLLSTFYRFEEDDGGRVAAGFRGAAKDCSTRAISIALDLPYRQVHRELTELQRCSIFDPPDPDTWKSAEDGLEVNIHELADYLSNYGIVTIRMRGQTRLSTVLTRMNLLAEEPFLIAQPTNHMVAIKNGAIRDDCFHGEGFQRYLRRLRNLYVPEVSAAVIKKRLEINDFV